MVKLTVQKMYVNDFEEMEIQLCVFVFGLIRRSSVLQCVVSFPSTKVPLNTIHIYSSSLPESNHPLHTHTPCLLGLLSRQLALCA